MRNGSHWLRNYRVSTRQSTDWRLKPSVRLPTLSPHANNPDVTVCVVANTRALSLWRRRQAIEWRTLNQEGSHSWRTLQLRTITDVSLHYASIVGGAVVQSIRHLGLWSVGRGFKSCSRQRCVTTLGKCLCQSQSSITWYRPKGGDALRLGR